MGCAMNQYPTPSSNKVFNDDLDWLAGRYNSKL